MLSAHCAILLKGGHHPEKIGIDTLYKEIIRFTKIIAHRKHGSGCVLSSAIVSNLALGNDLRTACYLAKDYIETYLQSNPTKWDTIMYKKLQYISQGNTVEAQLYNIQKTLDSGCDWIQLRFKTKTP
jgi:hydroxymethylpyrimidine/phosphomethylpyrimidine kinase